MAVVFFVLPNAAYDRDGAQREDHTGAPAHRCPFECSRRKPKAIAVPVSVVLRRPE
eukprot:CAMPEP_0117584720 /NCGR_PEP_ID=MMETSP0784-20121206/67758_1 /TAXON_ID=39447 /ORGANISM="" /LENGTH=55 /DNA_ID=CAMNT_0005385611 /DNA_START=264 /DNA_END=428 /DNA_ORIENTATION=-